jgi:hypothetical protein
MSSHGSTYMPDFVPPRSRYHASGKFGRLFGELPPFSSDNPSVRAALLKLGEPGGPMDAMDDLSATPKDLIVDPSLSVHNPNNPRMTAG